MIGGLCTHMQPNKLVLIHEGCDLVNTHRDRSPIHRPAGSHYYFTIYYHMLNGSWILV